MQQVKLTVIACPPVVQVAMIRPDVKYSLGFSVQNGIIVSILRGSIAERGGVRVGHRIIELNGQSMVNTPHERIVEILATATGEINMKTMPTFMYRLVTGEEIPQYI
jgi:amyloid beta (A4) precursor protein-binding family A protein 1 (X11)